MFRIGEFSKLARVSIRTLRHYDEIGLLVPDQVGPENGYRYYSAQQLSQIARIQLLPVFVQLCLRLLQLQAI